MRRELEKIGYSFLEPVHDIPFSTLEAIRIAYVHDRVNGIHQGIHAWSYIRYPCVTVQTVS